VSNSQYSQYSQYGTHEAYDPAYPPAYAYDVHSAQTLAYGVPGAYEDTYRPAYEAAQVPEPPLPRQVGSAAGEEVPAPAARATCRGSGGSGTWAAS